MAVKTYGIHDKWLDINKLNSVDVKSVDGVIESVKINGEEAGGGGSSDFTTANLQIVNQRNYPTNLKFATIRNNIATIGGYSENRDSGTYPVILYKGLAGLVVELLNGGNISVSGAIESQGDNFYIVTGDCKITIA